MFYQLIKSPLGTFYTHLNVLDHFKVALCTTEDKWYVKN